MRTLRTLLGGLLGLAFGCGAGFGAALIAMSMSAPRYDGTYGMREVLVCLPAGALLGLVAGCAWGFAGRGAKRGE